VQGLRQLVEQCFRVLGADARNAPRLTDLLGTPVDDASFSRLRDALRAWLESADGQAAIAEGEALCAMLPEACRHVGRRGSELGQRFLGRVGRFLETHAARLEDFRSRIAEAKEADRFGLAERLQRDTTRYLDQFLVDLFVRVGLIPTYSFPVDDVRLEVLSRPEQRGRERAFQARSEGFDLTRDAAYAIAEYAPAPASLATRGEFEVERYYRLCKSCNHPEIRDFTDQIPAACSNCGEDLRGPTATYLQPKGFVTSAAESDGRDPGAGRVRARIIDEARLVTSAPHAGFGESGVSGVTLAFLPAAPEPSSSGTPGEPEALATLYRAASYNRQLRVLEDHDARVRSAVFDTQGKSILTASDDRTARLWDVATGNQVAVLAGHQNWVLSAIFDTKSGRVLTASSDRTARLWDVSSGKQLGVLRGHQGAIWSATLDAEGERVVTASSDHTARVWDAGTGTQLAVLEGGYGRIWGMRWEAAYPR
jgi:hypothetical protein